MKLYDKCRHKKNMSTFFYNKIKINTLQRYYSKKKTYNNI